MRIYLIVIIFFSLCGLHAQQPTQSPILEGAKVVLEIFKAAKSSGASKREDCLGKADICFHNNLQMGVEVKLRSRDKEEEFRLIILPGKNECKLEIDAGIYEYEITVQSTEHLLSAGDIKLDSCKKEKATIE